MQDWTEILARAGLPEPPGYRETLAEMRRPGYESEAAKWRRLQAEAAAARAEAAKAAKRRAR